METHNPIERANTLQKKIKKLKRRHHLWICVQLCNEGYEAPSHDVAKMKFLLIQKWLRDILLEENT